MGIETEWRGGCQPDERTAAVRGGRKEGRMVPKERRQIQKDLGDAEKNGKDSYFGIDIGEMGRKVSERLLVQFRFKKKRWRYEQ